jgi:hypothetical protein
VPGEERQRAAERCSLHVAAPSVATCSGCGRELCLACAIPVRGQTLGVECLTAVLGDDAPVPAIDERDPLATPRRIAAAAFVLAAGTTVLPWSRFGRGAESFGAWGATPSWSLLAALAAVAGVAVIVLARFRPGSSRVWNVAAAIAGMLVVAGSILALVRPPAFTSPWLGPWVALVAGLVAAIASFSPLVSGRSAAARA